MCTIEKVHFSDAHWLHLIERNFRPCVFFTLALFLSLSRLKLNNERLNCFVAKWQELIKNGFWMRLRFITEISSLFMTAILTEEQQLQLLTAFHRTNFPYRQQRHNRITLHFWFWKLMVWRKSFLNYSVLFCTGAPTWAVCFSRSITADIYTRAHLLSPPKRVFAWREWIGNQYYALFTIYTCPNKRKRNKTVFAEDKMSGRVHLAKEMKRRAWISGNYLAVILSAHQFSICISNRLLLFTIYCNKNAP